jgi:hypothetical protein
MQERGVGRYPSSAPVAAGQLLRARRRHWSSRRGGGAGICTLQFCCDCLTGPRGSWGERRGRAVRWLVGVISKLFLRYVKSEEGLVPQGVSIYEKQNN